MTKYQKTVNETIRRIKKLYDEDKIAHKKTIRALIIIIKSEWPDEISNSGKYLPILNTIEQDMRNYIDMDITFE